jgi:hypothetical protein
VPRARPESVSSGVVQIVEVCPGDEHRAAVRPPIQVIDHRRPHARDCFVGFPRIVRIEDAAHERVHHLAEEGLLSHRLVLWAHETQPKGGRAAVSGH